MIKKDVSYSYGEFEDFKLSQLPYESGEDVNKSFSTYIFLPNATHGLGDLINKFKGFRHLKMEQLSKVWIPKMKFSHRFQAEELMKEIGLALPFDPMNMLISQNMVNNYKWIK